MEVTHHLLVLTLLAALKTLNPLYEMLKLRGEADLILIDAILHGIKASIMDYG